MATFTNYFKECYTWKSDSEQFRHLHKNNTYNNECISIDIKKYEQFEWVIYTHDWKLFQGKEKFVYF